MRLSIPDFATISIRQKIMLTAMTASLLALLLASVGFLTFEILGQREAALRELRVVGEVIARNSTAALSFEDAPSANETLLALRAEKKITTACLYQETGKLFASYLSDANNPACPPHIRKEQPDINHENRIMLALPVTLSGQIIGNLVIFSRSIVMLSLILRYGSIITLLFVISALMAYMLASRLERFISAPILHLIETSRRVSFSRDYSLRAHARSGDEIGMLITAYNEMLEQIQDRDRALKRHGDRLDEEVRTRTEELEQAVDDLREEITQRQLAEERIRYLAYYDNLTGLPNRQYLSERLDHVLIDAARDDSLVALLFLDLDRFKEINDSFGHSVGDLLLRSVAERLTSCVRASDSVSRPEVEITDDGGDSGEHHTVSRQGGDEFTILLPKIASSFDASRVASRILEAMREPIRLNGHDVVVSTSIGIAVFPHDGDDGVTLLKHADTAMYHAKQRGRNDYEYFSESMKVEALRKLTVEHDLRRAIELSEFELYYQPKFDARTGQISGLEALIRWNHPEKGMVPPDEFIAIAEDTGLIVEIGEWVIRAACLQARIWHDQGVHDLGIAVNVSSQQFRKNSLVEVVAEALVDVGLAPRHLEIEVTESTMMRDEDEAVDTILRLKEYGIQIALDDFGTGYSSLSYVRRLPLDKIKIDRSFINDLGHDSENGSIVTAIIAMAHSLGLTVVAEGVETEEQAHFLRSQGCDEFQGFLYSRPLPASAIPGLFEVKDPIED